MELDEFNPEVGDDVRDALMSCDGELSPHGKNHPRLPDSSLPCQEEPLLLKGASRARLCGAGLGEKCQPQRKVAIGFD